MSIEYNSMKSTLIHLSDISKIEIQLDDSIKRKIHDDFVKGYYEEDIANYIESEELFKVTDEQKGKILKKYFQLRQEAEHGWNDCLKTAFEYVLGYNYAEKYIKEEHN